MSRDLPILAVTPGDPEGIGPEIVWKAIRKDIARKLGVRILCVGARKPFERLKAPIDAMDACDFSDPRKGTSNSRVWLYAAPDQPEKRGAHLGGYQSGWAIREATHMVKEGIAAAIVTGPISKDHLQQGGFPYPGHTEFLAALCATPETTAPKVTMMLANEQLRISLVTTHIALRDVPKAVTAEQIRRAVTHTVDSLHDWWGIRNPHIAVAALNPHAGEAGLFGNEEQKTIEPALDKLRAEFGSTCKITGPLPADTLFANHILAVQERTRAKRGPSSGRVAYDAVICMYHDQGLIPVKLLDFQKTVNVTLGLPIVRTSVDHGVAFDIAGAGIADPSSLESALRLAAEIVLKKRRKKMGSKRP